MFQTKVVEKSKHILCSVTFFENLAFYEIMWKNVEWVKSHMTIWRMRIACWIRKATHTHTHTLRLLTFWHRSFTFKF